MEIHVTGTSVHPLYRDFGRILAFKRKEAGFTQTGLAQLVGVSRTTIANIETGKQSVPLHYLYIFSPILNVDVGELLPLLQKTVHRSSGGSFEATEYLKRLKDIVSSGHEPL